jgi:hypothetical protein
MLSRLLDSLGLPWQEPRGQVEARIGISHDPFFTRPAIFFPDTIRPPGFLQPWRADVFERFAPEMPIVRFTGLAWFADDARANTQKIADDFAAQLGPAPVREERGMVRCLWRSGPASLELQAWLPTEMSPYSVNPAQDREPRLKTASYVTLLTGFRRRLSDEEAAWVANFQPIATARPSVPLPPGGLYDQAPGETEVEYARDPTGYLPGIENKIGIAGEGAALILGTHQLFVVPAGDVLGFEVRRVRPAKGAGGSTLLVRCRTNCPGVAFKTLDVAEHCDPDGMTRLGREFARLFDTVCDVRPYVEAT